MTDSRVAGGKAEEEIIHGRLLISTTSKLALHKVYVVYELICSIFSS
jgi:hypothetical protein